MSSSTIEKVLSNIKRMPRSIPWTEEHLMFRQTVREFAENEVAPNMDEWRQAGQVSKDIWLKAGSLGLLAPTVSEEYGGSGADLLYSIIVTEELARIDNSGFFVVLHADIIAPYIINYATKEQKKRWLPGIASGEKILSISMTEPGTGSDLSAIRTYAEDKGDYFLLNGAKTFISNGYLSNLNVVAARTGEGASNISLLVVEDSMPGYERGKKLKKIGLHAQDTAEIFFNDVKVPKENLLGKKNSGFRYLMKELASERFFLAVGNQIRAEVVLDYTVKYVKERKAFGKHIGEFQNTRFKLTEVFIEQEISRAFVDKVILDFANGKKDVVHASMVKHQCSEMLKRHVDTCLQFFGGYGYMMEYPVAVDYLDSRVQTIYAGTTEIMKEIIARNLSL